LLVLGQRHDEPAEQERSLGVAERALVVPEPVDVLLPPSWSRPPATVYAGFSSGPSSSSRVAANPAAASSRSSAPARAAAMPAKAWSRIQASR